MNSQSTSNNRSYHQEHNKKFNSSRRSPLSKQPETTGELRPIFAAYLNMARMNLYNTLRYIARLCGIEEKENDEQKILNLNIAKFSSGLSKKEKDKQLKAYDLLMEYLPIIKSMTQLYATNESPTVSDEKVQEVLQRIIRIINFQRMPITTTHWNRRKKRKKMKET